jgi:hypothetical protein
MTRDDQTKVIVSVLASDDEKWLGLDDAIDLITKTRGGSIGKAQVALAKACESGEVRSWELTLPHYFPMVIPAAYWNSAHIDLITGEVHGKGAFWLDDGEVCGTNGIVQISKADLRQWLMEPGEPDATLPNDMDALDKAIVKVFDAGKTPPHNITWKKFADDVRDAADAWIDRTAGRSKRGYDSKTIERHARKLRK